MGQRTTTLHREWVERNFYRQPIEHYETLSFEELKVGDRFISIPLPGDNDGHGGFRGAHHVFIKISDKYRIRDTVLADNTQREKDKSLSNMPEGAPVIKIG